MNSKITKEHRLLVYFKGIEEHDHTFSIDFDATYVIRQGITSNVSSLRSMLVSLQNKNLIQRIYRGTYMLTKIGKDFAQCIIAHYGDAAFGIDHSLDESYEEDDESYDDSDDSNNVNDAMHAAFESMAKSFEAMSQSFAALAQYL